jgi:hypothetical protein
MLPSTGNEFPACSTNDKHNQHGNNRVYRGNIYRMFIRSRDRGMKRYFRRSYIMVYHTIGRYLALPTGSIRAGQSSPYFDNYMQEGNIATARANSQPRMRLNTTTRTSSLFDNSPSNDELPRKNHRYGPLARETRFWPIATLQTTA